MMSGAVLSALLCSPSAAQTAPAAAPQEEAAAALPDSPAALFAAMAQGVRPQWRPLFRETVPHSAPDRYKAALGLGAIVADCYLAAEARDAQQVRNLLRDMTELEMMLGIHRQMSSLRQKPAELAENGDWKAVRAEIALLVASHAQFLAEQKDEVLAELESLGCWVRTIHITAQFCAKQPKPPLRPCVWSPGLTSSLAARAAKLSTARPDATLLALTKSLQELEAVWKEGSGITDRQAATVTLLEAMMLEFMSGEDTPAADKPRP